MVRYLTKEEEKNIEKNLRKLYNESKEAYLEATYLQIQLIDSRVRDEILGKTVYKKMD